MENLIVDMAQAAAQAAETATEAVDWPQALRNVGAGLAMGFGAMGPGIGIGILGHGAMSALGRNPEARGPIMTNMLIAIGLCEAVAIYSLIVAIILGMM